MCSKLEAIMKKILAISLLAIGAATLQAQELMNGHVSISNLSVARNGGDLFLSMDVDLTKLDVKSEDQVVLTPAIASDTDTLRLHSIYVAGRTRWYHDVRNNAVPATATLYRYGKVSTVTLQDKVPYAKWMNQASVIMLEDLCGCNCELLFSQDELLTALNLEPKRFKPNFVYKAPQAEGVKVRELRGQAYIDFPVSRTEIYPEYRNNPAELQKIIGTIDAVRNDPDTRITALSIKGYASPESPYSNNTRLAKGRTETLKNYVQNLYNFPEGLITTDYEPEDWAGLRAYVEQSNLQHKNEILALIDGNREPDNKEWVIKSTYPQEYKFLLQNCYPALRHSDYRVEYVIRSFTDVEEAKRVMKTAPGKLSLNECYMVANSYEPGSPEYNETFETMVRLYPDDPVANLNAANVAMSKADYAAAERYLNKVGETPQTLYARGILAALQEEYETARGYFLRAADQGIAEATPALEEINQLINQ